MIKKVSICAVYLPPPVSFEHLSSFLENSTNVIEQSDQVIILGDFNLSHIGWSQKSESSPCSAMNYGSKLGLSLIDFMSVNNLSQFNNVNNVDGKILDLVLTDFNGLEVTESNNVLSKIDQKHPPLLVSLPQHSPHFLKPILRPRYNYFRADYSQIVSYLINVNWSEKLEGCQNVNEMTDIFYDFIYTAIDLFTPRTKPVSTKFPPWFTNSLIKTISEKNKVRYRFKKYKNPRDQLEFELLRERVHKLSEQCLHVYKKRIEVDICRNPKSFWRFIKDRRNGETTVPAIMYQGNQIASTGPQIAQMFASCFSSVFNRDSLADYVDFSFNTTPVSRINISERDIQRAIKKLDMYKGAGPDDIPPVFVRRCGSALVLPLSIIFNRSLNDGVFPDIWKSSKVVPVFKKGATSNVSNYRPISILSCIPKLFESLVCPFITQHLNNFISEHQHGFRKGHSVETNLVSFTSYLCREIDRGLEVDTIYMDFSSAFDKVCHSRLINKLRGFGIGGSLLEWFRSYLAKRLQFVVVNGHKSQDYIAISGVPQGSHLGPVLFSAFINDITSEIRDSQFCLFADDLKIYRTVTLPTDSELIQCDLDRINVWCNLNGMTLNTKKSYYIKFSKKLIPMTSCYVLNGDILQQVNEIRDLGVIMDNKLTFKAHIDTIVIKAARMLGFLKRNTKGFMSSNTKIILYNSLVRSQLEFASVVWGPHYATYSQRIESVQRAFTRHLAFHSSSISYRTTYDLRLKHFKMISLGNRRRIINIMFLKKLISGSIDCSHLLQKINFSVPYHCPRHPITEIFHIPASRTNLLRYSPLSKICGEYNQICALIDGIDIFNDTCPGLKNKLVSEFLCL